MRILRCCALLGVIAMSLSAQTDWPVHGHDPGAMRFSPLKQINTENVSKLQVAWTYDPRVATPADAESATPSGEDQSPAGRARRPRARRSATTPLVIDGVVYMSTAYNRVVALDADTGKELWVRDIDHAPATRGIAYWPGDGSLPPQIVFGTSDGWMISLNAKTGAPVPGFGVEGKVDLRPGVGENFPDKRVALSSPPTIYKNLVITGAHSQESPSLGPTGDVRAWDMRTGKLMWTFHTIPRPGEPNHEDWQGDQWKDRAGANAWGFITLDEERGIAYVPLGTPATDFYGGDRLGSNLYGSSLVALDALTGKLKWYFQTTHHDNWDYDLSAPPTLIDVKRDGKIIPAVAQYTKQGLLFIFDRVTGDPIFGVEERPVISDNPLPGDEYWPTQPFPVKPPPLARMSFSADDVAKVTPEHEKYCRDLLALEGGVLGGGPYAQYGPRLRVIFPGWTGGGNWNGSAFNPELGYLFTPSQDLANLNKMVKAKEGNMFNRVGPDNAPPGLGGNFWDGTKNWPCQEPPWGELIAVNVNTGDIAWRVPLGSFEELDALGVPATGTPNRGGPIATAGGLVFIGASQDARFRAFDARTGRNLWYANLNENGRAVPITYQGKSGKQYVAIVAGGGRPAARTSNEEASGGRLYVFALPDAGSTPATGSADARPAAASGDAGRATRPAAARRVPVAAAPAASKPREAIAPPTAEARASDASFQTTSMPDGPGKAVVQRMCAPCHTLESFLKTKRTEEKWGEVVDDMIGRGAFGSDEEINLVIKYLSNHFGTN